MTILEIITECAKREIPVSIEYRESLGGLYFVIGGFSKSGDAYLAIKNDKIICLTRYDRTCEIESFSDLSEEAWWWYLAYRDRCPFENPSGYWVKTWIEEGKLKKETKEVFSIV